MPNKWPTKQREKMTDTAAALAILQSLESVPELLIIIAWGLGLILAFLFAKGAYKQIILPKLERSRHRRKKLAKLKALYPDCYECIYTSTEKNDCSKCPKGKRNEREI